MKLKLFFLTLNLLISSHILLANKVALYHNFVNKAELLICKSDLKNASLSYDSAFAAMPQQAFAQDIYNASVCAIKINNFDKAVSYCKELVVLGCDLNFFTKKASYNALIENRIKWLEVVNSYELLCKNRVKQINWKLRNKIQAIQEIDQSAYRLRGIDKTLTNDVLKQITENIHQEIESLFKNNGYPSEKEIGIFIENDTLIINSPLNVLIRHSYQTKLYSLKPFLQDALNKGNLKPEEYMAWLDVQEQNEKKAGFGTDPIIVINRNVYQNTSSPEIRNKINSNRNAVFASSYDENILKIIESKIKKTLIDFFLLPYASISTLTGIDENMEIEFTKALIKTDYKF